MVRLAPVLIALTLAGCVAESGPGSGSGESVPRAPGAPAANGTIEPISELSVVDWDDSLVRGVWACNPEIGCEYAPSQSVYNAVFEQPLPVGNITGGNLSIAWEPVSQVTERLVLGFRIYNPDCNECAIRYNTEVSGASPLSVNLSADMYVDEGDVLRLWVYGAMIQGESTTATYAGVSDDQPFSVDGSVAVARPA